MKGTENWASYRRAYFEIYQKYLHYFKNLNFHWGCTLLFMFQWNWIFSINQKSSGACYVYRNLRENIKVILESIFLKVMTCRILLKWHALWHIKSGYIFYRQQPSIITTACYAHFTFVFRSRDVTLRNKWFLFWLIPM